MLVLSLRAYGSAVMVYSTVMASEAANSAPKSVTVLLFFFSSGVGGPPVNVDRSIVYVNEHCMSPYVSPCMSHRQEVSIFVESSEFLYKFVLLADFPAFFMLLHKVPLKCVRWD